MAETSKKHDRELRRKEKKAAREARHNGPQRGLIPSIARREPGLPYPFWFLSRLAIFFTENVVICEALTYPVYSVSSLIYILRCFHNSVRMRNRSP